MTLEWILKMADAAILDFANRFLGPPAMAKTDGLKCPLKFRVDLIYSIEDIAISIFLFLAWKCLTTPTFGGF